MIKRYSTYLILMVLACLLHSCQTAIYPAIAPNPFGNGIVSPMLIEGNENILPEEPNFVQSYNRYSVSKPNSRFGALIRIIEFEYDIGDSILITPRITSGFNEGQMTGELTIVLDQYELYYENPQPKVREYVEQVGYETSARNRQSRTQNTVGRSNVVVTPNGAQSALMRPNPNAIVRQNLEDKDERLMYRSQLYNSARFIIDPEDVILFIRSKTLYFKIHLEHCDIVVYPSTDQARAVKRMIKEHYKKA